MRALCLLLGIALLLGVPRPIAASPTPASNIQSASAVERSISGAPTQKAAAPKSGGSTRVGWLSSHEFLMSLSVLLFGFLTILIEIRVIRSGNFKPDDSIKLLAVTLIVVSTLFIITAGFDSEQIAPAMGLFGTVAGYMLGKASPKEASSE